MYFLDDLLEAAQHISYNKVVGDTWSCSHGYVLDGRNVKSILMEVPSTYKFGSYEVDYQKNAARYVANANPLRIMRLIRYVRRLESLLHADQLAEAQKAEKEFFSKLRRSSGAQPESVMNGVPL